MGAENTSTPTRFYNVKNFKFERLVKEKTETSETRETDSGKTFFIESYNKINGRIEKVMTHTEESADKSKSWDVLSIYLRDESGVDIVSMYFNDDASSTFLKRLPNIDLTKEVSICIRKNKPDNSEKAFNRIDVYQKDASGNLELVPMFEAWKGKESALPAWEKKKVNKKEIWDKTKQLEFFNAFINVKNAELADVFKAQRAGIADSEILANLKESDTYGKIYQPLPF